MKLVRFTLSDGTVQIGELDGDQILPIPGVASMEQLMHEGIPAARATAVPASSARLLAPVQPSKLMAVGKNYAAHAAEVSSDVPRSPLIFAIYPSSIIGQGEVIRWRQAITQQVDWEGELVIVIGKEAHHVDEAEALDYVFGYTIGNDITARDIQASESQWVRAKAMDTFCPLGPALVTADAIPDPQDLKIETVVNGETMQQGHTSDMVFSVAYLVAYLSQTFTLEPGDVILTGTPPGVGKGMKPPRFLTHGATVSVTIEPIGTLTNTCEIEDR